MRTVQELDCCLKNLAADHAKTLSDLTDELAAERWGNATLVAGTVTVADTKITAESILQVSRKTAGGSLGHLAYSLNAGVGFTITSVSNTDTSVVSYHVRY